MGFFEDMLDDGMRETRRLIADEGLSYDEAYQRVTTPKPLVKVKCRYCAGTGDSYFGSHCGACAGTGYVSGDEAARQAFVRIE